MAVIDNFPTLTPCDVCVQVYIDPLTPPPLFCDLFSTDFYFEKEAVVAHMDHILEQRPLCPQSTSHTWSTSSLGGDHQVRFLYLEAPLTGTAATGDSHGQVSTRGLQGEDPEWSSLVSVIQAGSEL